MDLDPAGVICEHARHPREAMKPNEVSAVLQDSYDVTLTKF